MPPVAPDPSATPAPAPVAGPRFFPPLVTASLWTLAAFVALGAGAIPWLLSDPARLTRLISRAVPALAAEVSIGRARVGWTGPIVIEDLRVVPHSQARPPLSIRRIEGAHGLLAILLSAGDLGRLRVEGLEADVVFNADRTSNLTGLMVPAAASAAAGGDVSPRRTPLRMQIEIEDAVARISGPWADESWASDPTDVRVKLAPLPDGSASAWTIDRVQLLRDATLEANVAQGVLAYIAPVLADATRTSGRFSLRIDGATFPVGAPQAARLAGVLSMHAVDVGPGPMVTRLLDSLPGRLELPRSIRLADDSEVEFHLANRRVWHKGLEFGLPLAKPGQRLDIHSSGSVGLDDRTLDLKLELPVPADLPADRPLLAALAGKSVSLGIGGVLGEPRVNFDGSIRATAGDVVADLVDRLRNSRQPAPSRPATAPRPNWIPPQPEPNAAGPAKVESSPPDNAAGDGPPERAAGDGRNPPSTDAIIDLVGGVLDEVAKRRAERAAANADNPQAPPPPGLRRGGRLLRRLAQPPAATPGDTSPAANP